MMSDTKNNRILYVEILRIAAIIFVVFNHTGDMGFVRFTRYAPGSAPYWACMFISVITGFSVRLFFMISGMLLLRKTDETIGYIWRKRILRYVVILFSFSLFYYLIGCRIGTYSLSFYDFLSRLYSGDIIESFWFLYAYIAYLIGLPFLRKIAVSLNGREFRYLLIVQVIFTGVLLILQYRLSGGSVTYRACLEPAVMTNYIIFYPLAGYYLGNKISKVTDRMLTGCFLLFLISAAVTMYITDYRIRLTGELGEADVVSFYGSLMTFEVIFIFLLIRRLFENRKMPALAEKIILSIGGSVLGIYLIEGIVRNIMLPVYRYLDARISGLVSAWIYVLLVVLICWMTVACVKYLYDLIRSFFNRS